MTLRLILTRHGKSDWDDPRQHDRDRPLTERGRTSAEHIGEWLAVGKNAPQQALVSTATRATETWQHMAKFLPDTNVTYHDGMYHAPPAVLLRHLAKATAPTVLMVAHNPGISELAEALVRTSPQHREFRRYPTGATLIVDFDITSWGDVAMGAGQSVDFVVPRDLLV